MIQTILTYIIISLALIYTFYSVAQIFVKKTKRACGNSCSCGSKNEIRKSLLKNKLMQHEKLEG